MYFFIYNIFTVYQINKKLLITNLRRKSTTMNISIIGGADGPTSIFLAGTLGSLFFIPALIIMLLFYGIYYAKKLAQKSHGIRTTQLGHGKSKPVRAIELVLSAATFLIVPIELASIALDWNFMPAPVRIAGIAIGIGGDLIFLAAVLTMKDSWRAGIPDGEKTEFVSHGIYRYSRNPAFLGFDMMYIGILLIYFNWILAAFTVWAVVMLHMQILQEENYLAEVFGGPYLAYKSRTGRYWGRKRA